MHLQKVIAQACMKNVYMAVVGPVRHACKCKNIINFKHKLAGTKNS